MNTREQVLHDLKAHKFVYPWMVQTWHRRAEKWINIRPYATIEQAATHCEKRAAADYQCRVRVR